MMMIFDFWGTLVEQGVYSPLKQISKVLNIHLTYPEFVVRAEKAMMTSKFDDLSQAFDALGKEFGLKLDQKTLELLIGIWNKNWLLAMPYEETRETLEGFKKNNKLCLMANTDCFSVDSVLDKFKLRELFDYTLLSYKIGKIKSEHGFFDSILSEFEKSDCLVIGDGIESDITPAKLEGLKAVLIDRKNKREYECKIASLKELNGNHFSRD